MLQSAGAALGFGQNGFNGPERDERPHHGIGSYVEFVGFEIMICNI